MQLLAEADEVRADERVVRVDPAAGAVGIRAAGRGLQRGGGVALGHERVDARAHNGDEVDVLPLDGLNCVGKLGRAVDAVGCGVRDAGLPAQRAAGGLHLQHEGVAARRLHGGGRAREPVGRDLVGRQVLRVQLGEAFARVGDDAGVVRVLEHDLGVDRLGLAALGDGGGRFHDGEDDVQRAVAVIDDVFLAGVEENDGQHDQPGEDPQDHRPGLAPAAPGAVNVVAMGAHRHTSFGSGGVSRGFPCR